MSETTQWKSALYYLRATEAAIANFDIGKLHELKVAVNQKPSPSTEDIPKYSLVDERINKFFSDCKVFLNTSAADNLIKAFPDPDAKEAKSA